MFSTFIMGLASATLIELGAIEDPITRKKRVRPEQARQHIEILAMLQDKTRGNLTDDERVLLERVLADVRMAFARTEKKETP